MNTTLLLMLVLPIIGTAVLFFFGRPNVNQMVGSDGWRSLIMLPAMMAPGMIVVAAIFAISAGVATHDTEIWSGVITGKARVHGTYEESYQCNCRTTTSGSGKNQTTSTTCDTCYRTHYTVNWHCDSTVGRFTIQNLDSTWMTVYATPDPARYTVIKSGDPASRTNSYTNYVQAVPESLFKPSTDSLKAKFAKITPPYPDKIYDIYSIDRFLQVGFAFADAPQWSKDISNALRDLGPKKQVNMIVIVAKTDDPNYMYAIRDAWVGAKKNDVVLLIGSTDGTAIAWVDVLSWTKNELFKIELRDAVTAIGTIDRTKIIPVLQAQIAKNFERRHMKEFAYLANEIDPPTWLLILLGVLLCAMYGGGAWYLIRDARPTYRRRY